MTVSTTLDALRDCVQQDVGRRGLASDPVENLLTACPGDFEAACQSVAATLTPRLLIVTGFFIPDANPPTGETDGPLGALFLARALAPLGIEVGIAAEDFCLPALRLGLDAEGLAGRVPLIELPIGPTSEEDYRRQVLGDVPWTHLLALERVGPGHTHASLTTQSGAGAEDLKHFTREVAEPGRCRTMRGLDVTEQMSPAHWLFETPGRTWRTIGVGDGGNEIGMGKVAWRVLRRNITLGGLVACRVPTDYLVVCGVSNWGAYALAAGVRLLRGVALAPALFDPRREYDLLRWMVEKGGLVDGKTGRPTATVDGLDFDHYAAVLQHLAALGQAPGR